jgi:predicted Zn finger-like uncharacterized protein
MILTCPSCETQYFADDDTIGEAGRSVKCAACGHAWHVHGGEGAASGAPIAAGGAHETYREKVRERRQRKSRFAASMAWFVSGILFAGVLASGLIFRNDVVRVWPEAANAYKALGFEVNRFGLDFNTIEPSRTFDGTTPVLTVKGTVVNISSVTQPGADVRIGLRDENGDEVGVLTATMSLWSLPPGEQASFEASMENPPVAAFELELSFVDSAGTQTEVQEGGRVVAAPEADSVAGENSDEE